MSEATPTGAETSATQETATPPTTGQQTAAPTGNSEGFSAADFADPVLGPKIKNMQRMNENSASRAKKLEEEAAAAKQQIERVRAFYQNNPDLYEAAKKREEGLSAPEEAATASESEEELTSEERLERKLAEIEKKMDAMNNQSGIQSAEMTMYAKLGGGDIAKGRDIYRNEYAQELTDISSKWNKGSHEEAMSLALELAQYRRKAKQPTPQPEPEGTAVVDRAAGTALAPPGGALSPEEQAVKGIMASMGANNIAEYTAAVEGAED